MEQLFNGFVASLSFTNLFACFIGCLVGTIIGVLPGLGPTSTLTLMLPFTLKYGPETGLIMMAGCWFGAQYGGSTTSILVNIPGESASVVTCIDGYQMAKKGRAGAALAVVAGGSFLAGTIGIIGLQFFAPLLGNAALSMGPPEYLGYKVPEILLSGNHAQIAKWRREQIIKRTLECRPELLDKAELGKEDKLMVERMMRDVLASRPEKLMKKDRES